MHSNRRNITLIVMATAVVVASAVSLPTRTANAEVSEAALAKLSAERPAEYFEYAEQLATESDDPAARDTALRLYLIAAHLDPGKLGLKALRAMDPLARNEAERRRIRAMAYLLDPDHDRQSLERLQPPPTEPDAGDAGAGDAALLNALRMLRRGQRSDALAIGRRPLAAEQLARHSDVLTPAEFELAANSVCRNCEKGEVDCTQCGGAGRRKIGASLRKCPDCNGQGANVCSLCGGDYQSAGLSAALLAKILRLEVLLASNSAERAAFVDGPAAAWAAAAAAGAPAPTLSLQTITEFDPQKCLYLRGRWVEP